MSDARSLYKEGLKHLANDRIDEAVDCYRRATEAAPDLALAWNGLSLALKQKGDLDDSEELEDMFKDDLALQNKI